MNRTKLILNLEPLLQSVSGVTVKRENSLTERELPALIIHVSAEDTEEGMDGNSQCVLDLAIMDNSDNTEAIRNEVNTIMCDPDTIASMNNLTFNRPRDDFHVYDIKPEGEDFEPLDNNCHQTTLSYRVWCRGSD